MNYILYIEEVITYMMMYLCTILGIGQGEEGLLIESDRVELEVAYGITWENCFQDSSN